PLQARFPELRSWNYSLSRNFQWSGKLNSGIFSGDDTPKMLPWNLSFNYSFSFSSKRVGSNLFKDEMKHTTTLSATLQPTPKWKLQYNTAYDYTNGEFSKHQLTFSRDLSCWSMTFTWTPVGAASGWHFTIYITDLPDIKLQAGDTQTD
ncbi:MAG TPA: LPS-assembly protein LptD, partial [Fibrobacteraceae bacterium]|nr:LPS-assembly protein LptD [Fibrobacteraceae bacterium]